MSPLTTATPSQAEVNVTTNGHVTAPKPSVPTKSGKPSSRWPLFAVVGLIVVVGAGATLAIVQNPFRTQRADLLIHKVQRENLLLTIVERGTLESVNCKDVVCRVRSGGRTAPTIKTIHVEDGAQVREGDLLIELDDSTLQEALKSECITLDQAKALYIEAKENLTIVLSENESNLSNSKIAHELAGHRLNSYVEGEFPQQLQDIKGRELIALSDLNQWRDRAAWSERMVKKGYLSPSQAESEQAKLKSAEIGLDKIIEEKRVLETYTKVIRQTELERQYTETKRDLQRWEARTNARKVSAETNLASKQSLYEQALRRHAELNEEIAKCKITAPQDGMVVYYVPEQARSGGGSQQSIIAQGEPVRDGQKLMTIPNLEKMAVNTNVHEAMVSKVTEGQHAVVRIDALPDRILSGVVTSVATVNNKQDWMSADVKLYKTMVTIEESVPGLKPGMSARVTILIDSCCNDVMTIPVHAVIGAADAGKTRSCFVRTALGPVERDIVIGASNDRMVEVLSGLEQGDEVVINPKVLLADRTSERGSSTGKEEAHLAAEDKKGEKKTKGKGKGKADKGGDSKGKEKTFNLDAIVEEYRALDPQARKAKLEQVPEAYRDKLRSTLRSKGIDIP